MPRLSLQFAVLASMLIGIVQAPGQVTGNVYTRVFEIKAGGSTGSAFALDLDGRQYLVTAKHMVAGLKPKDSLAIYENDQWSSIDVSVFLCDDPIDIAVLVPPRVLTHADALEPGLATSIFFGQDVYFLGFPYGLSMNSKHANNAYPFALVKKGIYSANIEEEGVKVIILDGNNNFGFSGGPIVYRDLNQSKLVFYVLGVISGFKPDFAPVVKPEVITPGEDISKIESWRRVTIEGQQQVLRDTGKFVLFNTGLVRGYPIEHAVKVIHEHPIGPKINQ
jgi:hypothetical protein